MENTIPKSEPNTASEWKVGDTAYHEAYGKVKIFEISKTMPIADVMTEEKLKCNDGSMKDSFVVRLIDLYSDETCGKVKIDEELFLYLNDHKRCMIQQLEHKATKDELNTLKFLLIERLELQDENIKLREECDELHNQLDLDKQPDTDYRDRLDRMVAAVESGTPNKEDIPQVKLRAVLLIAAIDEEVKKRKGGKE